MCDGQLYSTSTYPALFSVIGYSYGGSGGSFAVPDARGRASIGAGAGTGLTNRVLAAKGGEETHVLSLAELPAHNHVVNDPGHSHSVSDPSHSHGVSQSAHAHSISDPGHHHRAFYEMHYSSSTGVAGGAGYNWTAGWQDTTAVGTGIGIYGANANISINGAGTGIGIYASGTGISTQNAGGGAGHNSMMPWIAFSKIIKV
jgi:microcystin-dependent protein